MNNDAYVWSPCRLQFVGVFSSSPFGTALDAPAIWSIADFGAGGRGFRMARPLLGPASLAASVGLRQFSVGAQHIRFDLPAALAYEAKQFGPSHGASRNDVQARGLVLPRIVEVQALVGSPPTQTSIYVQSAYSLDSQSEIWFAFEDSSGEIIEWNSIDDNGRSIDLPKAV